MLPIKTILHPTDFSTSARYAFRLASSLAKDHGTRLVVMHVAGPAHANLYGGVPVLQRTPGLGSGTLAMLLYRDCIPDALHPVAEIEFTPNGPGKEPIRMKTLLTSRC